MRRAAIAGAVAALAATVALGIWLRRPARIERRNVILVSVDTLRADASGFGASPFGATPNLDRLARRSVVFSDCISSAPHTEPAHASLFTGLEQRRHGLADFTRKLPAELDTLAEILGQNGWRTAAITNSPKFSRSLGLDQGFQTYEVVAPYETQPWLERVSKFAEDKPETPLFLFLHVLDPHAPYDPAPVLRGVFHEPYEGTFDGKLRRLKRKNGGGTGEAYRVIDVARAWYRSEVLEVDEALGQILARLRSTGLLDDAVVILTSDHGEEFLDHGGMEHSHSLYEELIHVPLLIHAPEWPEGVVITSQVRTVDLLATILALCGVGGASAGDGIALRPDLRTDTGPAVSERDWNTEISWRAGGDNLRYDLKARQVLAYTDLRLDPGERENRVRHAYARVEALTKRLESWLRDTPLAQGGDSQLDPQTREAIEALGYTGR